MFVNGRRSRTEEFDRDQVGGGGGGCGDVDAVTVRVDDHHHNRQVSQYTCVLLLLLVMMMLLLLDTTDEANRRKREREREKTTNLDLEKCPGARLKPLQNERCIIARLVLSSSTLDNERKQQAEKAIGGERERENDHIPNIPHTCCCCRMFDGGGTIISRPTHRTCFRVRVLWHRPKPV